MPWTLLSFFSIVVLEKQESQYWCTHGIKNYSGPQCLKIAKKVAFNIASEASYVYILSDWKFIKNANNGPFWRVLKNLNLAVMYCYQPGHYIDRAKLLKNAKNA